MLYWGELDVNHSDLEDEKIKPDVTQWFPEGRKKTTTRLLKENPS
jgi:hypothetical protein